MCAVFVVVNKMGDLFGAHNTHIGTGCSVQRHCPTRSLPRTSCLDRPGIIRVHLWKDPRAKGTFSFFLNWLSLLHKKNGAVLHLDHPLQRAKLVDENAEIAKAQAAQAEATKAEAQQKAMDLAEAAASLAESEAAAAAEAEVRTCSCSMLLIVVDDPVIC